LKITNKSAFFGQGNPSASLAKYNRRGRNCSGQLGKFEDFSCATARACLVFVAGHSTLYHGRFRSANLEVKRQIVDISLTQFNALAR
jgi:hypothetical protein